MHGGWVDAVRRTERHKLEYWGCHQEEISSPLSLQRGPDKHVKSPVLCKANISSARYLPELIMVQGYSWFGPWESEVQIWQSPFFWEVSLFPMDTWVCDLRFWPWVHNPGSRLIPRSRRHSHDRVPWNGTRSLSSFSDPDDEWLSMERWEEPADGIEVMRITAFMDVK